MGLDRCDITGDLTRAVVGGEEVPGDVAGGYALGPAGGDGQVGVVLADTRSPGQHLLRGGADAGRTRYVAKRPVDGTVDRQDEVDHVTLGPVQEALRPLLHLGPGVRVTGPLQVFEEGPTELQIGRASGRERVCQYV